MNKKYTTKIRKSNHEQKNRVLKSEILKAKHHKTEKMPSEKQKLTTQAKHHKTKKTKWKTKTDYSNERIKKMPWILLLRNTIVNETSQTDLQN